MILGMPYLTDEPKTSKKSLVALMGPAFVAAVAYVDPGNVAANITAGARYGYTLVWVLVLANLMAMLVQYESAKLGIVTGRSLPQVLGDRLRRPGRLAFWIQAEVVAGATDLAEVIGGAIALNLLFGTPLLVGGLIIGVVSLGLLFLQNTSGQIVFERVIIALLLIITLGFVGGLVVAPPSWQAAVAGLRPTFPNADSVLVAASMLGATVMPHAIYLHSSLTKDRHGSEHTDDHKRRLLRATKLDVFWALLVAGSVNIALVLLAAASLHGPGTGQEDTDTIEGAYHVIAGALGGGVATVFAVGLLASGLASTSVGAYAGSEIMAGLLHIRVPLLARRVVTLIPGLAILAFGFDPTWALVLSQALLSLGIPFALLPLVIYTSKKDLMGQFADPKWLLAINIVVAALIVALNLGLLVLLGLGMGG